MMMRDLIRMAYSAGDLDTFLESFDDDQKRIITGRILEAVNADEDEIESNRWLAVIIPYGGRDTNLVCMFRSIFLEKYTPTCEAELKRLTEDISPEERRYLRQKVAAALCAAHKYLVDGLRFGNSAYDILMAAEVPYPLGVDALDFIETFLCDVAGVPRPGMVEGQIGGRGMDPISQAIDLERALARAHIYFLANGPDYDPDAMSYLKELLPLSAVTPILIRSQHRELQSRFMQEILLFAESRGDTTGRIKALELFELPKQELEKLFSYRQLMVSNFASQLLKEEEEAVLEDLIRAKVRLIFFTAPEEDAVFASDELNKRFCVAHKIDIDKV